MKFNHTEQNEILAFGLNEEDFDKKKIPFTSSLGNLQPDMNPVSQIGEIIQSQFTQEEILFLLSKTMFMTLLLSFKENVANKNISIADIKKAINMPSSVEEIIDTSGEVSGLGTEPKKERAVLFTKKGKVGAIN